MPWWKPDPKKPRVTGQKPPKKAVPPPQIRKPPKSGKGDGKGR